MRSIFVFTILCMVLYAFFEMPSAFAGEVTFVQTDTIGNPLPHKGFIVLQKDGRLIQTDSIGNKLYHKKQYKLVGGKVYLFDNLGNVQILKGEIK